MYIIGSLMTSVSVTESRQHLPEYLKQVQAGEAIAIAITLHGKTIAISFLIT